MRASSLNTLPYFYPRPPCGGRRKYARLAALGIGISIHALRVEGDICTGGHLWAIS